MKRILTLLTIISILLSCSSEEKNNNLTDFSLAFSFNWDNEKLTIDDLNEFKFTNENGELIKIERLRYLISNVKLTNTQTNEEIKILDYQLVNISDETSLSFKYETPLNSAGYKLSFTFGFPNEDNQDGVYQDLNSANFNVPGMLGGGYHYMQFDGKYKDANNQDQPFNYHAIRAVDRSDPNNLVFEDTSFQVELNNSFLVTSDRTEIGVQMNIAEWFKNPNTWDLNELNTVLMPNFDAQKLMSANGKSVFSLGAISISIL